MQPIDSEHLSATAAQSFLESVLEKIRVAIHAYALEMEYPIEAMVEVAFT